MYFSMDIGEPIAYISFGWATSYDSDDMYLELWRPRLIGGPELLWSQHVSGQQSGWVETAYNTMFEGDFYYKVVVAPELPAGVILGITTIVSATAARRRRWR